MNVLIILINILIIFNVSASDLNSCMGQGDNHGDGRGRSKIDQQCFEIFFKDCEEKSISYSNDQNIFVLAYKNIIYFEKYDDKDRSIKERYIISGNQAKLAGIEAIDIDEKNKNIHILQLDPTRVSLFRAQSGGNISPSRILQNDEIAGASNIVVNPILNELALIFKNSGKVIYFNRKADIHGRHQDTSMKIKRQLFGPLTTLITPIDAVIDKSGKYLIILDQFENQVAFFDWNSSGDTAPIFVIKGERTKIKNPQSIYYSKRSNEIEITNKNGDILSFNILNFEKMTRNSGPKKIRKKLLRKEKYLNF